MIFQKDGETFESRGGYLEQVAAAEKHFGVKAGRDGEWNMLGILMVWIDNEQLEEWGVD
ncbi:hypothetical protein [Rhizobium ruizarguesonis]|uniref:hypothetical protein n=1 Tax=Rhizobium ruizarguesonis TaxID=2081791 RepID=UPI0013EE3FD0|nr:hypothetical protein [Rhizobium ruizarguesonis]